MEYKIDLYDGHLLINEDGKTLLLDTGSPVSLTDLSSFSFRGHEFNGHRNIGGKGVSEVSQQLGRDIDVLVGMDVLHQFTLIVDYKNLILGVFEQNPTECINECAIYLNKAAMGAITIPMSVDGQIFNFALDTGAKISYINRRVTSSDTPTENRQDFNPVLGYFSTPIFPKDVEIGGKDFLCDFGNLPQMAEIPLKMMGIDGVIGFDLFRAFKVCVDFRNNVLYLS